MPERVPREVDLFSSYPCPQQQQQQRIKNMDSRHGFSRLGSRRWPRQARRGGWKTREDGSECRAAFSMGWRRMARLCSASEKSFDYGRWSKWPARREHDPTEGQERLGRQLWLASVKSLRYGPYPSGKREETTATRDLRRFFVSFFLRMTLFRSFTALLTDFPARIAPLRRFWVWNSYSILSERHNIWMRDSHNII